VSDVPEKRVKGSCHNIADEMRRANDPIITFSYVGERPPSGLDKPLDMGDGFFINSISGPWPVLCPACGGEGKREMRNLLAEAFPSFKVEKITIPCRACDGRGTVICP
jgi:hypothetical protein